MEKKYRGKKKALDPTGLQHLKPSEREEPAAVFWAEKGGTPFGLHPDLAEIPITPEMRLWILLDEELVGAGDAESVYHRPSELDTVFGWYAESLEVWAAETFGEAASPEYYKAVARKLLRKIGAGRATARAESRKTKTTTPDP